MRAAQLMFFSRIAIVLVVSLLLLSDGSGHAWLNIGPGGGGFISTGGGSAFSCYSIPGTSIQVGAGCLPNSAWPSLSGKTVVDPVSQGADPTGATNSYTAIGNAITAAGAGGAVVFNTPGTYTVDPGTTSHGLVPLTNQIIECAFGKAVTLIIPETDSGSCLGVDCNIFLLENTGITIIGCTFAGSNSASGPAAESPNEGPGQLEVTNNNITIEGNVFRDSWDNSAVEYNSNYTAVNPSGISFQYNSFFHNPLYAMSISETSGGTVQYNYAEDGDFGHEPSRASAVNSNITWQANMNKVVVGNCKNVAGQAGICNAAAGFWFEAPATSGVNFSTSLMICNYSAGASTPANQSPVYSSLCPGGTSNTSGQYLYQMLGPFAQCDTSCGAPPSTCAAATSGGTNNSLAANQAYCNTHYAQGSPPTISEVNAWTGQDGTTATFTAVTSTGTQPQVGDVMIAAAQWYSSGITFTGITGGANGTWTTAVPAFASAYPCSLQVLTHVVTSADIGGTFTFTFSQTAFGYGAIADFRGVSTGSPIDTAGSGSVNTSTTALTAASINLTSPGEALVYIGGACNTSNTFTAPTSPGTFSTAWNLPSSTNAGGGLMAYQLGMASGASGAVTATASGSVSGNAVLLSLIP